MTRHGMKHASGRHLTTDVPGPRSREQEARRRAHVSDGFGTVLPVFVDHAEGALLVDVDGNRLLDMASGIAVTSVGAAHPKVAEAVAAQAAAVTHTCFMVTEYTGFVDLAETLARLTPGNHEKRTALFSTGAEAVENAVKIARTYTGRPGVLTLEHGYHGRTYMAMSMTAKQVPYKDGFGPFPGDVHRSPNAYPLRWPGGADRAAEEALAMLKDKVLSQIGPENLACIVAEPIAGEGGFIIPAPGFLKGVADFAAEHGILFVADEIQTGFARTGSMFASEHEGLVPDLVTSAKAMGGGLPISAVTGRAEVMNAVPPGSIGGTYAGNPVACAAALAAIDVIESENLTARARRIEELAMPRLQRLVDRAGVVVEARGRGAMLALELVEPGTTTPSPARTGAVAAHCHAQGVLVLTTGTYGNVIRLLPPLVIDDVQLDDALAVLEDAVAKVAEDVGVT